MATRIVETLFDDLDESTDDVRTVSLELDGRAVEIDLSAGNFEQLSKVLTPYFDAGRRASSAAASRRRRASTASIPDPTSRAQTQAIREWAQANGVAVNTRGRIKREVVEAYEAANR